MLLARLMPEARRQTKNGCHGVWLCLFLSAAGTEALEKSLVVFWLQLMDGNELK